MRYLLAIIICMCSGCASYKLQLSDQFNVDAVKVSQQNDISAIKTNGYPQGAHCFEPMLYVLTLGIIPTHCVDDYEIRVSDEPIGKAELTTMSGWIPLLISVLPNWKHGDNPDVAREVKIKAEEM